MKVTITNLIASICLNVFTHEALVEGNSTLMSKLVSILNRSTKLNQLLFLYRENSNNCFIHQMVNNIARKIPTRLIDFKNFKNGDSHSLKLPANLVETTIVIIIPSKNIHKNSTELINILDFLPKLTKAFAFPRILIATQVSANKSYRDLLKLLWPKHFLDVTVLEFQQGKENKKISTCSDAQIVKQHYYNPFTKKFNKSSFSEDSILFPSKVRNLNGYNVHVGMFHYPPYIYIKRNSTEHFVSVKGPDVNLAIVLSDVLNYTLKKIIFNRSDYHGIQCVKEKNIGILKSLVNNKIQLLLPQTAMFDTCFNNFALITRGTRRVLFNFVVPILPNEAAVLTTESNYRQIMIIFFIFLIPWMIAKFLKFDRRYWNFMYTLQIALGFPSPRNPQEIKERLIFLSLLTFYLLESSYIFTVISNSQLQKESSQKIETFKDVLAANLTVVSHSYIDWSKLMEPDDAFLKLMNNSIYSSKSFKDCTLLLIDHKNISCEGRGDTAQILIEEYKKANNKENMKILKDIRGVKTSGMYLTSGSPLKYRIEKVTLSLMESGINNKWDAAFSKQNSIRLNQVDLFKQDISVISKLLHVMVMLLLLGYVLSLIVFASEIFFDRYY